MSNFTSIKEHNMKPIEIDKKSLERMVYQEEKSQREIAKLYNCSEACISKKMKSFGITKTPEKRYIGKEYGQLMVVGISGYDKYSHAILNCICKCGREIDVVSHALTSGNTKSCGCTARKRGNEHPNFKGYEQIQSSHWNQYTSGAEKRGLEFTITMEYAWSLFVAQNGFCALSGKPIFFPKTRAQRSNSTASLDRIDSSKGYIPGNVQWVHKIINKMKWNMDEEEFFDFCKSVSEYQSGSKI